MLSALPPDTLHAEGATMVEFLERMRGEYGSMRDYAGTRASVTRRSRASRRTSSTADEIALVGAAPVGVEANSGRKRVKEDPPCASLLVCSPSG